VAALDPSIIGKYDSNGRVRAYVSNTNIIGSSGRYLADGKVIEEQPKSVTDLDMAEKLWALSEKLVHHEFKY